jgi:Protein of unknown function (DUF3052)
MGLESQSIREASGRKTTVKALIEPPDLILRGETRLRLPISRLEQVRAEGDRLLFTFQAEPFALTLGITRASKWVTALTTPPPSLAKKLGISADSVVRTIGPIDDEALQAALSAAGGIRDKDAGLILARVNSPADLARALRASAGQLAARVPIWLIYPKGKGQRLTESDVRSTALAAGIVDTKVASVSPVLTALRFVRRRGA